MRGQQYTVEQLEHLRQSPLVQKPDGLPSIDQWMETPAEQNNNNNNNNRRPNPNRQSHGEAGALAPDRPQLINAGGMGHFGRRPSHAQAEETVLGPPKLAFASARAKKGGAAETTEGRGATAVDGELGDRFPRQRAERWRPEREGDGTREKGGYANGRRAGREEGEGWTNVKGGRKSLGQDDFDRDFGRNGERSKVAKDADADGLETPARRAGGREKFDRWARRDDTTANPKENDAGGTKFAERGQGGWRDRQQDRGERGGARERDWTRGAADSKAEEDPDWMNNSRPAKETKVAHTQEDFQKWMEAQRQRNQGAAPPEKSEKEYTPVAASTAQKPADTPAATATPSALDSSQFFANWLKDNDEGPSAAESPRPAATAQAKKSRFGNFFQKPEEPTPVSQPPAPSAASPAPGKDDDGFNHVLQMLAASKLSAQPTPQQAPGGHLMANGLGQGGIMLPAPQPEERQEIRPQGTAEQRNLLNNILQPKPSAMESRPPPGRTAAMSPEHAQYDQFGPPRPEPNRGANESPFQQPPRNSSARPEDMHIHAAVLASRQQQEKDRDSSQKQSQKDFLLSLMQQGSRATPPQLMNQNLPRQGFEGHVSPRPIQEGHNMSFFEQAAARPQPPPQPKGRGVPPGFMDESRFMPNDELLRREQLIQEARFREMNLNRQQQENTMRAKNMPMNFNPALDDPAIASLQRRNTAGELPRQMTNMGIPSQPLPDVAMFAGRNPGMPPTPNERSNIAPPPGFGMRQPPGLSAGGMAGLNGPPSQQMPPFSAVSAGNTPMGPPPGFPRGPFPGPGGPGPNQMPPQSYFPPPNYGPPMGMRGQEDPRMMMPRPEFDQFGGPGPRQGGRPGGLNPNMY